MNQYKMVVFCGNRRFSAAHTEQQMCGVQDRHNEMATFFEDNKETNVANTVFQNMLIRLLLMQRVC